jgi:cell wall-associated NlpC family hydrolase
MRTLVFLSFALAAAALSAAGADRIYIGRPVAMLDNFYPRQFQPSDEPDEYSPAEEREDPVEFSHGSRPTVSGRRAILRRGVAYAPSEAPMSVKQAIWAVNTICRKPYRWGGGHGSFIDSGYDCSGTVSFALHAAGVLDEPNDSRGFLNWGERGRGRWITVYSRRGHTFAVIAGLRLDTTGRRAEEGPRWRADSRDTWGYRASHPRGL